MLNDLESKNVDKITKTIENKEKKLTTDGNVGKLKRKVELIRKNRAPLEMQRRLTSFPKDPDYMYRWVNDVENNIYRFHKAGWEHVDIEGKELVVDKDFQDASWKQSALSQKVGGGITAYVMRIPREIYIEDQERKYKAAGDYEQQLKVQELSDRYKIKKEELSVKFGQI